MRIKRTLQPYIHNEKIKFGFGNRKLERSIENNSLARNLIQKLDSNSDTKIFSTEENLLIEDMISLGLITNNDYGNSLYSRNYNFFEWIDLSNNINPEIYQNKLKESTVLIVGLGGIGSTVSEILTRLGVGNLILLDFDIVEDSNLTRQSSFCKKHIGKPKIEIVSQYLNSICDVNITTINKKIQTKSDLETIYSSYNFDLSICCADTPYLDIDYWFDDLAHEYKIPLIVGSYASTVVNYLCIIPEKTISLRDFYSQYAISDDTILDTKAPTSVIAPISYLAASLISYKAFDVLTNLVNTTNYIQIDCLDWRVYQFEI